ncbi:MAG: glycosyltransferase family 2 protein [Candidatus Omnitrophica bacterium]|nr:glycosyltransferase family 2 protein [Candidatus Omnitrophota bacterium]
MTLSVIMPVYNERATIDRILTRVLAMACVSELIVVDDGSTDGTAAALEAWEQRAQDSRLRILRHARNRGKAEAMRTALKEARGAVVVVQDADLEYHPEDYPAGLRLISDGYADAVYGSRFLGPHRVFYVIHYAANKFLTLLTNLLYDTTLSDMTSGYKMVKRDVLQTIRLRSKAFAIEAELTAKLLKRHCRLYEIPITYTGRGYEEGKKITWVDGIHITLALVKFRLMD